MLHDSARQHGGAGNRWRLADVARVVAWLRGRHVSSVSKLLRRLGLSRLRALPFIHSPDPAFRAKWQAILDAFVQAVFASKSVVMLFMDELTYYRQPSLAPAYHPRADGQPRAQQAPRANTQTRVVAALNGVTGQVTYLQRSKIGKAALVAWAAQLRAAYPDAATLYVVLDNWPTHKLPEVLAACAEQRLTLVFLPTYASWLNPIEKLWRWLKQQVLHLHPHAADLDPLRKLVCHFLEQFDHASPDLLRYVGILPD